jgi:hypothetical protein
MRPGPSYPYNKGDDRAEGTTPRPLATNPNGVDMPKLVITHNVADVSLWLKHADERAEAIGRLGGTNVVDHVAHDGSGAVAVAADVDDVPALVATLQAPPDELAEVMQRHGVQPPFTIYVEG